LPDVGKTSKQMGEIYKTLKNIGLISLIVAFMQTAGLAINNFVNWQWLVYFFTIIRKTTALFGFFIDLPTLYTTAGIILTIYTIYWSWRAGYIVIKWFRT